MTQADRNESNRPRRWRRRWRRRVLPALTVITLALWLLFALSLFIVAYIDLRWPDAGPANPRLGPRWTGETPHRSVVLSVRHGLASVAIHRGKLDGRAGQQTESWKPNPGYPSIESRNNSTRLTAHANFEFGASRKLVDVQTDRVVAQVFIAKYAGKIRWDFRLMPWRMGLDSYYRDPWFSYASLPTWSLPLLMSVLCAWRWVRRVVVARRHRAPNACAKCGYDLSATPPDLPCPECGAAVARERSDGGELTNEAGRDETDAA